MARSKPSDNSKDRYYPADQRLLKESREPRSLARPASAGRTTSRRQSSLKKVMVRKAAFTAVLTGLLFWAAVELTASPLCSSGWALRVTSERPGALYGIFLMFLMFVGPLVYDIVALVIAYTRRKPYQGLAIRPGEFELRPPGERAHEVAGSPPPLWIALRRTACLRLGGHLSMLNMTGISRDPTPRRPPRLA